MFSCLYNLLFLFFSHCFNIFYLYFCFYIFDFDMLERECLSSLCCCTSWICRFFTEYVKFSLVISLKILYSAPLSLFSSFGTLLRVVYIISSHRRSAPHHHPHFFFSLFFRLLISIHLSSNSLAFSPSVQPAIKDIEWIF